MVPTLVLDDGSALFDSPVICDYLDRLHTGPRMIPESGAARWQVLREQALATDGVQRTLAGRGVRTVVVRAPRLVNVVPA